MLVAIILHLSVLILCVDASAVPSVDIGSPVSGTVLTSSEVIVTGTAMGSDAAWNHGGTNDFMAGIRESMVIEEGSLRLARTIQDNFDDDLLNTTTWDRVDISGVVSVEEGHQLHQYGTHQAGSYWAAGTRLTSVAIAGESVEATLKSITGTGTGWGTMVAMVQDSRNSVCIGVNYDPGQWGTYDTYIYFTYVRDGVQTKGTIRVYDGLSHHFKISRNGSTTELYINGGIVMTVPFTPMNPVLRFATPVRVYGDTVDAIWDDAVAAFVHLGNYTSAIHDTRTVDPLLTRVDWNGSVPSNTGMAAELRSSDAPDMGSPTAWLGVSNGQTAGLPAAKRYVQFRVTMSSSSGLITPDFKNLTVTFHKQVKKVEMSLDNSQWIIADGTTIWSATLILAEGTSVVYARVTDAAGGSSVESISLDVDLTVPTGSVLINGGAELTAAKVVSLSLAASDRYGVVEMRISETPEFDGADWVPFTTSNAWSVSDGDGLKYVYVTFKDSNGWVSKVMNDSILLDMTAPVGSVSIDDGAAYTSSPNVTLSLDAQDIIGAVDMRVWEGGEIGSGIWEPFTRTREFQLSSGDGTKMVLAEFRDLAGHISVAASDSIVLDTTPPIARALINDNAAYTNSTDVVLGVIFEEANVVDAMQVGADALLANASWEAPGASRPYTMSAGDGPKTIYVRARDAAGNVGVTVWDNITLDTTAPIVQMGGLVRKSPMPAFNVTWTGTDGIIGVASYDIQYRYEEGPWTDWFKGTNITQALFMGEDRHEYSFHARARDLAGNLGVYSATILVRVLVPVVSVTIEAPLEGATVEGKVVLRGTAFHSDAEIGVRNVTVLVDGGTWLEATGTTSWTFEIDTETLKDGIHIVRVVAYDGQRGSQEVVRSLNVDNPDPMTPIIGWLLIIVIIFVVIIAITLLVLNNSRKP